MPMLLALGQFLEYQGSNQMFRKGALSIGLDLETGSELAGPSEACLYIQRTPQES